MQILSRKFNFIYNSQLLMVRSVSHRMNFQDSALSKRNFNLCNAFLSKQCPEALPSNIWLKITQDIYLEQLKEAAAFHTNLFLM